jgi:hypothetical protein
MSSSAVDIAWMSSGRNALPSRNGTMVMVLPRRTGGNNQGPLSRTETPAASPRRRGFILAPFGSLDEPELGPNPYRANN